MFNTEYRGIALEGDLADASISLNRTVEGAPFVVVDEAVQFPNHAAPDLHGKVIQSRTGHFDTLDEICLTGNTVPLFTPNFTDMDRLGLSPDVWTGHRIIDVHPQGAILFLTAVVKHGDLRSEEYFMQMGNDTEPVRIPPGVPLGFTADSDEIILRSLDEYGYMGLFLWDAPSKIFREMYLDKRISGFLTGSLTSSYLCTVDQNGCDSLHLRMERTAILQPVPDFKMICGVSNTGVVIGYSERDEDIVRAEYMHPDRSRGSFLVGSQASIGDLGAYVSGIRSVVIDDTVCHLVPGSAVRWIENDGFEDSRFRPEAVHGVMWCGTEADFENGGDLKGELIQDRVVHASHTLLEISELQPNLSMRGRTKYGDVLLIPTGRS